MRRWLRCGGWGSVRPLRSAKVEQHLDWIRKGETLIYWRLLIATKNLVMSSISVSFRINLPG